jgi:hypothetical protein
MLMKVAGVRKLGVSNRSWVLVIPLCALLLASGIWNVRQYRFVEEQRLRAVAAAQEARAAAARVEAEARRAKLKKKAALAETDARVGQLYQEINNLTRISEQFLLRDRSTPGMPAKKDSRGGTADAP